MLGLTAGTAVVVLETNVSHDVSDEVVGANVRFVSALLFGEYLIDDAIPPRSELSTTESRGRACHLVYRAGPCVTDTP